MRPATPARAVTGLVLGIVAFVIWIIPFAGPFLATACAIAALVLGALTMRAASRQPHLHGGRGIGIAALVLGIAGTVIGILAIVVFLAAMSYVAHCEDNPDDPDCEGFDEARAADAWRPSASAAADPRGEATGLPQPRSAPWRHAGTW